ncbi:MAG: hypothetical protein JSR81_13390 [Proteobacteria bacterium]|nr:hypothetical protein [Pseudomonadota bacterium]
MTLSDLAALGSFVSGAAVLVSLVFLWFQLRQSEKNQRAQIRQVHSMRISDSFLRRADHAELWERAYRGDKLSDAEIYRVLQTSSAVWFGIEDSFYQYRDGLLDETTWQAKKNAMRLPQLRAAWPLIRSSAVGAEFVLLADRIIAETRPVSTAQMVAQYREALLHEMQAARSDSFSEQAPMEKAP